MAAGRTILIADDDPHVVETVKDAVATLASRVMVASTAAETWRCVVEEKPQLVLLDIHFPDASDLRLLKRIREEASQTEVIMISGLHETPLIVESIKSG